MRGQRSPQQARATLFRKTQTTGHWPDSLVESGISQATGEIPTAGVQEIDEAFGNLQSGKELGESSIECDLIRLARLESERERRRRKMPSSCLVTERSDHPQAVKRTKQMKVRADDTSVK